MSPVGLPLVLLLPHDELFYVLATEHAHGMYFFFVLASLMVANPALAYLSAGMKDQFLSDMLLRELVDRMGKDLAEAADSYIDPASMDELPASRLALMARVTKDLEAEPLDYDSLLEGSNPNPSPRDQEYLQHSTLWGHQYVSGGAGEGPNRPKPQVKTDASLPAYCNPPNPCPVGYTEDQGCTMDFENTAAFSREYQAAQDCMCDAEHMFNCPVASPNEGNPQMDSELESFIARQFHTQEHKNLVAKKFHVKKSYNPFLQGEKLPVAAKKGFNVNA